MTARGWAYAGTVLGFAASIAMNVSSTYYQTSGIPLAGRIVAAVLWPVAVYVGIEIITRTDWRRHWTHILARLILIIPVGGVAATVSYLHAKHVLGLLGEIWIVQIVGPLAIDGLLFGCAFVLRITSGVQEDRTNRVSLADRVRQARADMIAVGQAAAGRDMDIPIAPDKDTDIPIAPDKDTDIPIALDMDMDIPTALDMDMSQDMDKDTDMSADKDKSEDKDKDRSARKSWDKARAVSLLDKATDTELAAEFGVSTRSIRRLRHPVSLMKDTILSDKDIAETCGMSVRVVADIRNAVRESLNL